MLSPVPYISAKITRRQQLFLKTKNSGSLSFTRTNSTRKRSVIWHYPWFLERQVAHLILTSILSDTILPALYNHSPRHIVDSFFSLNSREMTHKFVMNFIHSKTHNLVYALRILETLIQKYNFDSTRLIMITYFAHLQNHFYLPYSTIKAFITEDGNLNMIGILEALRDLDTRWRKLWSNRLDHNCLFCQKNLVESKPILARHLHVIFLPCCQGPSCADCFQDFMHTSNGWINCIRCKSPLCRDGICIELDNFATALFRNQVMSQFNINHHRSLVLDSDLGNTCVGSEEFRRRVVSGQYLFFTPKYYAEQNPLINDTSMSG